MKYEIARLRLFNNMHTLLLLWAYVGLSINNILIPIRKSHSKLSLETLYLLVLKQSLDKPLRTGALYIDISELMHVIHLSHAVFRVNKLHIEVLPCKALL